MVRVFIMTAENGHKFCVNATTDFSAEQFLAQGGVEVPQDEVERIFGGMQAMASPDNTHVSHDGKIIFNPPDLTVEYPDNVRQMRDALLMEYDHAMKILNRYTRLTRTIDEQRKVYELIAAWDAYAEALCAIPENPDFPWKGSYESVDWPEKPALPKLTDL